jgi:GntR family transcriptional regulator
MTVSLRFHISFKSGTPVYLQSVEQVKAAAASGAMRTGESLPGIRPLAEELRVNRNTVAKAYAELEAQGVVATEAGRGSFLAPNTTPFRKDVRLKLIGEAIDRVVVEAHHLRVDKRDFLDLVIERYDLFADKRGRAANG